MKSISKSQATRYKFYEIFSFRFEVLVPLTKTAELLGAIVKMPPMYELLPKANQVVF